MRVAFTLLPDAAAVADTDAADKDEDGAEDDDDEGGAVFDL